MRHIIKIAGLAVLLGAGTFAAPDQAAAQGFSVRIGPDRDRYERRIYREPRVIERRIIRPAPRRTVCTTQWRTTVRANGTIVRRPTEVCRTR